MTRKEMIALYNKAKQAELGAEIVCPACCQKHIKTTYNKVFCSNARTRGRFNCKDMFWNKIDPQKQCNTTRISPASQAYMNERDKRRELLVEDYDPGDSEYWDNSDNCFP